MVSRVRMEIPLEDPDQVSAEKVVSLVEWKQGLIPGCSLSHTS